MKWAILMLCLLTIGVILRLELLVFALYVVCGVWILSRLLTHRWIENLEAVREYSSQSAPCDSDVGILVHISNKGVLPVPWLIIEDGLPTSSLAQRPPRIRIDGKSMKVATLFHQQKMTLFYTVHLMKRGYYQLGPLLLETGDLFGLFRKYKIATKPVFILVYPKIIPLQEMDITARRPMGEIRVTHRLFEDPTRFAGIRPYHPGDPMNRIHWKASARAGVIQSKIFDPSSISGATFLFDFHEQAYKHNVHGEIFLSELMITTVASLANAFYELGQQIGLITNARDAADRIREEGPAPQFKTRIIAKRALEDRPASSRLEPIVVRPQRGPEQLNRILETLARAEISDGISFPELVNETCPQISRDTVVIAVLAHVTPEISLSLGMLRTSGYYVTAILVTFDEHKRGPWAKPSEWEALLVSQGVEVRWVEEEEAIGTLCQSMACR